MNTLRDTAEGRPRPSVWPAYVAAALIGGHSLLASVLFVLAIKGSLFLDVVMILLGCSLALEFLRLFPGFLFGCLLYVAWIAVGLLATWGVARLRAWGWWCAAVWIVGLLVRTSLVIRARAFPWSIAGTLYVLTLYAILIWSLATRRQLFFPPKPEGEE